jgi:lactoylglutathione lyase
MKFKKLTPNLFVRDVEASMKFYQDVLGFQKMMTVPETVPYVFGAVTSGDVEIFFNDVKAVAKENPSLVSDKIGGTMTMYIEVEGIESVLKAVENAGAKINMALTTQFYGMREFGFVDPGGWMVTIAEPVKK